MMTGGSFAAASSPACVGAAINNDAAAQITLGYDAGMLKSLPGGTPKVHMLLAVVVIAAAACGGGKARAPDGGPDGGGTRWTGTLDPINRNVDILFLIDDSSSMGLAQERLRNAFPVFTTRLMDPPGLPSVHIAVVSSDMGADDAISDCDRAGSKMGIFQSSSRVIPPATTACTTGLQPGASYISNAGGVANYTGNLEDAFSCIAALGETGCNFEQPFAAILRALGADGQAPPLENQGFLRDNAALAIIMFTNEDDCSPMSGSMLFDTVSGTNLASMFGPPVSFRCNEFGHVCDGARPRRTTPGDVTSTVLYGSCVSNDTEGFLLKVTDTVARIKALKTDPSRIAVASIQGPPTPYNVTWKTPTPVDTSCGASACPWPEIGHSCVASDGRFADPGVRTAQLVNAFGSNGLLLPFCDTDLGPALDRAATLINSLLGPPCITGALLRNAAGGADCTVTEHYRNEAGAMVDKAVPSCFESGDLWPCWQLTAGSGSCGGGRVLDVKPDPNVLSSTVTYDCAACPSVDALDCI
jgi:hypothetical protein